MKVNGFTRLDRLRAPAVSQPAPAVSNLRKQPMPDRWLLLPTRDIGIISRAVPAGAAPFNGLRAGHPGDMSQTPWVFAMDDWERR